MSPRVYVGTIVKLGIPSTRPPCGARGHNIVFHKNLFRAPADLTNGHSGRKIGEVIEVSLSGDRVNFTAWAFRPVAYAHVSFGTTDAQIHDLTADLWEIRSFRQFTHLAVVPDPAHAESSIRLLS